MANAKDYQLDANYLIVLLQGLDSFPVLYSVALLEVCFS